MRVFYTQMALILSGIVLLAGCSEDPPPRSVGEFIDEPIMLEAAMVRCLQNRSATRYDAECVNARHAAQQIEAKEETARRAELETQSERKRLALRRAQQAASQARKRAAENERLREEAEYLAQFAMAPPVEGVVPEDGQEIKNPTMPIYPEGSEQRPGPVGAVVPASDGGNAPMSSTVPDVDTPATDLEAVRDELQRRNDESAN